MSEKKFCPECNAPLEGNEAFCDNCGASLATPSTPAQTEENSGTIASSRETDGDDITRNNVMGSINKTTTNNTSNNVTTNKIDNSTTQTTSNVTSNSSSIDNSTVNNNTTIVMGGKSEPEFCEVCGNPFEGKHARCPKCGKSICFDCKVKGKNRCVECEKKAINEYRMAFQELLMTTQGNIGIAGRQMMNRKAQELDVEDKMKAIEADLSEIYKPQNKAQQPTIVPAAAPQKPTTPPNPTPTTPAPSGEDSKSGVGALNNRKPLQTTKTEKKSSKTGLLILVGVLILVVGYFIASPKSKEKSVETETSKIESVTPKETPKQTTETTIKETPKAEPVATDTNVKSEPQKVESAPQTTEPASQTQSAEETQVEAPDADYDAGMKAYNEGNSLDAVKKFKASGSAKSYYMLGVIYEKGCGGVAKNPMMARQNFKKAAQMGSTEAKAKL